MIQKREIFQTVRDNEGPEKIEKNGPIKCVDKDNWLGDGYYFWDGFIDNAHWWGKTRYRDHPYIICRATCYLTPETCLDLVGEPTHLDFIKKFFLKLKGKTDCNVTLKKILEYWRYESKISFPYTSIRANGVNDKNPREPSSMRIPFHPKKSNAIELCPPIQICFYTKKAIDMNTFCVVFPEEYNIGYGV